MPEENETIGDAAKGGRARAKALTPEERREIAKKAAEARWHQAIPQATHEGDFKIGETTISAAVLPGGKRILSQGTFLKALGRSRTPKGGTGALTVVDEVPFFLQSTALQPFITSEIVVSTTPVVYLQKNGKKSIGYDAESLPDVADVYLQLRDSCAADRKPIPKNLAHIVMACDMLTRSLAKVGIVALVDEATGFQFDRPQRDLEEHLKKYMSDSLRRWVRTFPYDYLRELCRLRGVELRPDMRLPKYFGHLTNNLVYKRLAPGILKKLKSRKIERGNSSDKLHSWLSEDVGVPELLLHLGIVIGLMKLHTDYKACVKQLDTISPIFPNSPGLFDDPKDWE